MHTEFTVPSDTPQTLARPSALDAEERLFRHTTRPDWGVGLWVREELKRRRLRFEDGELRAFRKGFYHFLVPVDPTNIDVDQVFERLANDHEMLAAEARQAKDAKPPVMSFADQIRVFKHLYPAGFSDPAYVQAHRAPEEGGTERKRHIDPVIAEAKGVLSKKAMKAMSHTEVYEALVRLLDHTALVKPGELAPIGKLPEEDHEAVSMALFDLLHGKERYRLRFERWLRMLGTATGGKVTWALASAPPALLRPKKHTMVKASAFSLEARCVAPGKKVMKAVSTRGYRRGRRVALKTFHSLEEADLAPRDLFDVYAFIWETVRPKSQKLLEELGGNA